MRTKLAAVLDHFLEAAHVAMKRRLLGPIERKLELALRRAFSLQERAFLKRFASRKSLMPEVTEALTPIEWEFLFDAAALETIEAFVGPIDTAVKAALLAGGKEAMAEFLLSGSFDLANPIAATYIQGYGANLVTGVNETTKAYLRTVIMEGLEKGWSYDKMAKAISDRYGMFRVGQPQLHIDSRAHLIAVQEAGQAFEYGNMVVAQDLRNAGLEMEKSYLTVGDDRVSELCRGNEADGWIPLDQSFSSGAASAPGHVACLPGDMQVRASGILAMMKRWYNGDLVIIHTASGKELSCTPNHPILTPVGWVAACLLDKGDHIISNSLDQRVTPGNMNYQDMPARIEDIAEAFGCLQEVTATPMPMTAKDFHGDGIGSEVAVVWANRLLWNCRDSAILQHDCKFCFSRRNVTPIALYADGDLTPFLDSPDSPSLGEVGGFGVSSILFGRSLGHHQSIGDKRGAVLDARFEQAVLNNTPAYTEDMTEAQLRFSRQIASNQFFDGHRLAALRVGLGGMPFAPHSSQVQMLQYGTDVDSQGIGNLLHCLAGMIFLDEIVGIERHQFAGHVYNLQTRSGWYSANDIITHNCRCCTLYRRKGAA